MSKTNFLSSPSITNAKYANKITTSATHFPAFGINPKIPGI
ncbi:hypothetical protein [Mycoplasmopsis cynos]|nr:hypothetical protein [Mycoplasmopsis cynos]MCU9934935.1 hypothetical protein [Mycoplasmopsis cynos]UWV81898.1 hypothetical protein NW065_02065 [Mycoplasmopsis cynos]UWV83109.1 hypothetical protein NW067_02420 [Mycoplasmopsis cynos]UWV85989.1 hypothetical protein NW063_03980 [Mycoplasmopsis cynos]UWV92984.1 hypothetical protein NWE57_03145 [Mycoplasmopsis cynos]